MSTLADVDTLVAREDATLTDEERRVLGNRLLENFEAIAAHHASERTVLSLVKVYRADEPVAVAPVVKVIKHDSRRLLEPKSKWWLVPLIGPFGRATSYMIDTTFMGFAYESPFFCAAGVDRAEVKRCVSDYLKSRRDAEAVWIAEPEAESDWTADEGYDRIHIIPMAQVRVEGHRSLESYLAAQPKRRRHHARQALRLFQSEGGTIEQIEWPLDEPLAASMHELIKASAERSWLMTPYSDVSNDPQAFRAQRQTALLARVDGELAAFFSMIEHDGVLLQCHGGLDYDRSQRSKAYFNLLLAAVGLAAEKGLDRVGYGPLNNETKRRAADELRPVVAGLWTRNPLFRAFSRHVVAPNLQAYRGRPE